MPLRYTQRILQHLSHHRYEPSVRDEMAKDLNVEDEDRRVFDEAIGQLSKHGQIIVSQDGQVRLPSFGEAKEGEVTGRFKLSARGFGFVIPDSPFREGDLFVPPGSSNGAVSRDRVRAKVIRGSGKRAAQAGRHPYIGRIAEVLTRAQSQFTGVLIQHGRDWIVEPDGRTLHDPVLIRDPRAHNAKQGNKVVFEMVHYPGGDYLAEGVITRVLGEAGRPDVETEAVIAAHDLRTDFSDEVRGEAHEAARTYDKSKSSSFDGREDLTDSFIFTIDPPDAKDFDDAISISRDQSNGHWTLGVHIADVAHFVTRNSSLDEEARLRGNSVYLPRLVLPMLPESLSNGVCSLQEGVPRLAKSAFITFDGKGNVQRQRLASTVIRSRKRLTYLEAQALIDGNVEEARRNAVESPEYSDELIKTLKLADTLARTLRERRRRDGMIVLNLPEVDLVFDDHGRVVDAVPEDNAFTHTIIEMFMVEANEAVARVFDDLTIPILRRIHPDPAPGDIEELRLFARAAKIDVPNEPTRRDLQRLLELTAETPAARAIHFAVLRTLTKATYSPAAIGHFALASQHYAHFTSPIRRYPDLTLHRAIQAYLDVTDNGKSGPKGRKSRALAREIVDDPRVFNEGELIELGNHCSETEVQAEQAERELREFLVLQFLHENHLGDEFTAVITGLINSGVFVSLDRFLIEGRVRWQDVGVKRTDNATKTKEKGKKGASMAHVDRWIINDSIGRAVAQRSGAVIGLGDVVTAQIAAIDLASRHMELLITKLPARESSPSESTQPRSSRGRKPTKKKRSRGPKKQKRLGRR